MRKIEIELPDCFCSSSASYFGLGRVDVEPSGTATLSTQLNRSMILETLHLQGDPRLLVTGITMAGVPFNNAGEAPLSFFTPFSLRRRWGSAGQQFKVTLSNPTREKLAASGAVDGLEPDPGVLQAIMEAYLGAVGMIHQ